MIKSFHGSGGPFWKNARSVGSELERNGGIGPGFDHLRVALSLCILILHTLAITRGDPSLATTDALAARLSEAASVGPHVTLTWWQMFGPYRQAAHGALVPMFFALSGFLVTGSAFRLKNIKTFFVFRALRIFPALTIEVILSAFFLGAIFTTLPLSEYFTSVAFVKYLANVLGIVEFHLPGVFASNPWPNLVNANLWTLPSEFYCYLITAIGMSTLILYNRIGYTVFFILITLFFLVVDISNITQFVDPRNVSGGRAVEVTYYFFVGALFYHWKKYVFLNRLLFILSGFVGLLLMKGGQTVIASFFVTYCTIFLGMTDWRLPSSLERMLKGGDYSYGIYLYGFPIVQALIATFPFLRGKVLFTLPIAISVTVIFAVMSWHLLERPVLQLKKYFLPKTSKAVPLIPADREVTTQ